MKVKLLEACNISTGKLDSNAAEENGKYPFFTCAPEPMKINSYAFDEDAILLAGNNAQGNFHIQRYNGKFNAYQRTYIITTKEGWDIDFVKYSIEIALSHLKKISQGSQTKFLTMGMLEDFVLNNYPFERQKAIIASLKKIDKKIELNTKINDNLQQELCLIYEHIMSQSKKGLILGTHAIASELSEITTGREDANFADTNGKYKFFTCSSETLKCNHYAFNSSSILIAGNGEFNVKHFSGKFNAYQRTYVLTPKQEHYGLLYLACLYQIKSFKSSSAGSIVKFITKGDIDNIPVFIPDDGTYLIQMNKLLDLQEMRLRENEKLLALRDFLLPLLMNGQATIAE